MGSYNPKLLNAKKWKRKRSRIIRRDKGQCTTCGSKEKLCVHHTYYYKDYREPWRYPDESLITLCEKCHNKWHKHHKSIYKDNLKANRKVNIIQTEQPIDIKKEYSKREPSICWAEIQAHKEDFIKDKNGTWRRRSKKRGEIISPRRAKITTK